MCGRASGVPGAKGWHESVYAALGDKNSRVRASRISVRRGNVELYI